MATPRRHKATQAPWRSCSAAGFCRRPWRALRRSHPSAAGPEENSIVVGSSAAASVLCSRQDHQTLCLGKRAYASEVRSLKHVLEARRLLAPRCLLSPRACSAGTRSGLLGWQRWNPRGETSADDGADGGCRRAASRREAGLFWNPGRRRQGDVSLGAESCELRGDCTCTSEWETPTPTSHDYRPAVVGARTRKDSRLRRKSVSLRREKTTELAHSKRHTAKTRNQTSVGG